MDIKKTDKLKDRQIKGHVNGWTDRWTNRKIVIEREREREREREDFNCLGT